MPRPPDLKTLGELKAAVDTLITIPNQRLLSVASKNTSLRESFQKADDVLLQAVRGISELVTVHGLINLDFADVRSIMAEMGMAMMGAATASGENRAVEAATRAISSPLLEDVSIKGARGLLINVTGGTDMALYEVNEAASLIQEEAHEDANIIFGAVIDDAMSDEIRVTVIATGFGDLERASSCRADRGWVRCRQLTCRQLTPSRRAASVRCRLGFCAPSSGWYFSVVATSRSWSSWPRSPS